MDLKDTTYCVSQIVNGFMLRDGLFVNRVQANLNCRFHPASTFLPVLIIFILQKDSFFLFSWGVFKVRRLCDKFQICWGYSISTCDCEYWRYLLSSALCLMMPRYFAFLFAGLAMFGAEASLLICSYVPNCFPFPDVPVSSFVFWKGSIQLCYFDHCSTWLTHAPPTGRLHFVPLVSPLFTLL